MTEGELHARHAIMMENYILKIQIESRVMADLAMNAIIPAAIKHQNRLIQNVQGMMQIGLEDEAKSLKESIRTIARHIAELSHLCQAMEEARKEGNSLSEIRDRGIFYCIQIKQRYFEEIRNHADKLEALIDDADWPLPKYRELLFLR